MSTQILAETSPGEVRVAVVRDGVLSDYGIWRAGAPDGVGDVHRGRVIARVPSMAGAFVALAGAAEGFLPDSQGGSGTTEGAAVGVRVVRAAQGGKGPRLTARLAPDEAALVGTGPPALLRRGPDAVRRLAALHSDAPVVVDDAGTAATLRPELGPRVSLAVPAWDEAVAEQVAALSEPWAVLPGGARASFYPTPALVAIDVDAAAATAARDGKAAAQRALNRAALMEIARQIRLRNLSGAILVDLAGMAIRKRAALGPALAESLVEDPLGPRFLGFTALGLAEIVRPRVHPPLHEMLAGSHAAVLTALRAVVAAADGAPGIRPVLRAAPAMVVALDTDPGARAALAQRLGRPTSIVADPSLPANAWRVEHDDAR
jgi:Ribonuclease G/E